MSIMAPTRSSLGAHERQHKRRDAVASAKLKKTGFLHLPSEIRNRIYEDAIFDHDRDAVFLPRLLPRKVHPDGERDSALGPLFYSHNMSALPFKEPVTSQWPLHGCHWTDGERPPEAFPLPPDIGDFSDESDDEQPADSQYPQALGSLWWDSKLHKHISGHVRGTDAATDEVDRCDCCSVGLWKCKCVCHQDDNSGHEGELHDADSESTYELVGDFEELELDVDGYWQPPQACLSDTCKDRWCDFCAGKGLGSDEDEERYPEDERVFCEDNDVDTEDGEHYDGEEIMGMLFQTKEPPILLVCKEICEQCLPVYYGCNAFSWRFFWLEQDRSLQRFNEWATQVVGKHAKHIARLSFEGRHSVEEGIEFEVDVNLLEEVPFFELAVQCLHLTDDLTDAIVEAVEQDFITILWKMSRRDGGEITLSSGDICMLGKAFVDAMTR